MSGCASDNTMFGVASRRVRWYAADTPVMPEPMMHISASEVREPVLPAFASEFASGESQKDWVGLWMGSGVGLRSWASGIGVGSSGSACVGVTPSEAEEDIWCVRTTVEVDRR